ncbi:MAG: tyrosine-type recombinase/integrase [Candidatus Helarchaeota archaeon]
MINEFISSLNCENTKKAYKTAIKKFVKFINNKNLQLTTKMDFENYFKYLNNRPDIRKKTKMIRFVGVTAFFQYFMHKQEIDRENVLGLGFIENPITDNKKKWKNDPDERVSEILTNDEIKRVLGVLRKKNYRDYMIFYILADTSMRGNGLVNIKIKNINLEKRLIKTWDKGKLRTYAFGKNLKSQLENYLIIRNRMNFVNDDKEYLFYSRKGNRLSAASLFSHIFPKIAEIIKDVTGKRITAHDLRRSFKTNRTNLGQLREQIEALMNHKNGLDDFYNKPTDDMFLKWFDAYEEL